MITANKHLEITYMSTSDVKNTGLLCNYMLRYLLQQI